MMKFYYPAIFYSVIAFVPMCSGAIFDFHKSDIVDYFGKVVGFEESSDDLVRRFESDILIYVRGKDFDLRLLLELREIIEELNELVGNGIKIDVTADPDASNFDLYFMTEEQYIELFPSQKEKVEDNYGYYTVYYSGEALDSARVFVDTERSGFVCQKHLLREELTQAMGLGRDANDYSDSIFQEYWTCSNEYSILDRELIWLMYHSDMRSGVTIAEAVELARRILCK